MKPDCTKCGVCYVCPGDQNAFCDVMPEDVERLDANLRKHILAFSSFEIMCRVLDRHYLPAGAIKTRWSKQRSGPYKGWEFNVCSFLQGSIFHNVKCRVYDQRPKTCHVAVKRGDKTCRMLRRIFKEERFYDERLCNEPKRSK